MTLQNQKPFSPSWFFYPHIGIAVIIFGEEELSTSEVAMGNGEFIREATPSEVSYQTHGILEMVLNYFSIISGAPIYSAGGNKGIAS